MPLDPPPELDVTPRVLRFVPRPAVPPKNAPQVPEGTVASGFTLYPLGGAGIVLSPALFNLVLLHLASGPAECRELAIELERMATTI